MDSIVALTLNHMGDVLFTEPAITAIKAGMPNSRLIVVTSPESRPVLSAHPAIDELWTRRRGFRGTIRLAMRLRQVRPSIVVSFSPSSFGLALAAFLSGAPKRIGFAVRPVIQRLFTTSIPFQHDRHVVFDYLTLAELAGGKMHRPQPRLFLNQVERSDGLQWLDLHGCNGQEAPLGCHPFSSVEQKEWPLPKFASVLKWAKDVFGWKPVIFGSPCERAEAQWLAEEVGGINAVGTLSLRQFIAVVSWCVGFVGGDSGPIHIAAALGVPALALFGPTDPTRTAPLGERVRVVRAPTQDIGALEVATVLKAAKELWES
ncbi:MAG TPA: glycosyltransferase family 9 protein [Armatimonadetes bacterium]|nr:glycosyltransferase family 9 protein [Armatimonadota bacterium]